MKRTIISQLPIAGICFLTFIMAVSCNRESKKVSHTDFFGVNLDENDNQVEKLHNLILAGEVKLNGKVLREWTDNIGTDYWLSEGQMVSIEIERGDVEYVSNIRDSLNFSYSERFTSTNHLRSKQWVQTDSGENYFEYIDFYQYRNYSIGVHYRIISPVCDETNITSAEVRVGLGLSKKNTKELRNALVEAYNSKDWEKVVSYGMTMEDNGDSIGDLTIAYAEGLCALEMYEKARTLISNRIEAHSNDRIDYLYKTMGMVCYLEDKKDEALVYYKKAVEINPYYARVFINMAEIYTEQGKKEKLLTII